MGLILSMGNSLAYSRRNKSPSGSTNAKKSAFVTHGQQGDRIWVVLALEEEGAMIVEVIVAEEVQGAKQKVLVTSYLSSL